METSEIPINMPKRSISDATIGDMVYANYSCYKMVNQSVLLKLNGEKHWSMPSTVFRSDLQNRSYVVKTEAGVCYRRNLKHLQGVPNVLPSVPNDEPDDVDIPAEDPGEVVPPDDPGDTVMPCRL